MIRAIVVAIVIYLATDATGDYVLAPMGIGYMHAFIAMFLGMGAGGYLAGRAGRGFIGIALVLSLAFSTLTYVVVAQMREQSVISLILEQHPMVSVGSFVGALLGAWLGGRLATTPERDQPA